jgi:hypothetical protein
MEIACSICGKTREQPAARSGKPRTPRGWKSIQDRTYCQQCKSLKYALRAVTIPVAKCDWKVAMPVLKAGWKGSVRCANWLLSRYYQADTIAADTRDKLPSWKTPYLYPEARAKFDSIEPTVLVSIINTVSGKYRAARFDLWRGAASLPVYRDMPLPMPRQNWELSVSEKERMFSVRINRERHAFVLRSGAQFRRQHRMLDAIASAEAEAGEASLYERGDSLMLKIAAWFSRGEVAQSGTQAQARTCVDGFLVATCGQEVWRLNADHVQRWIVGAAQQQQRLREDLKAERRFPKRMREGITARMNRLSQLRRDRLNSWINESTTQLVNWSKRKRAASLIWDDTYGSAMPSFPWFQFSAVLEQKCEMAGIELLRASEGATVKSGEALADSENRGK